MKKRVAIFAAAVMLLGQTVFAAEAYQLEKTAINGAGITVTGEMVKFTGMSSETFQKTLNMEIEDFYEGVMEEVVAVGEPKPSVGFNVTTSDTDDRFTLMITATVAFPENTKVKLFNIALDDNDYKVLKASAEEGEVFSLSVAEGGFYMDGGVAMVPLRKACEFFGYEVTWEMPSKSSTVYSESGVVKVQPLVNDYYGMQLERPPVNKNGSVYVPVSFFSDILGIYAQIDLNQNTVILAKPLWQEDNSKEISASGASASAEASAGVITGTVIDASMNGFTILYGDGAKISFPTQDNTDKSGLELDALVSVVWTYDGRMEDFASADISKLSVASVRAAVSGATVYAGKVVEVSANTVSIKTESGRTLTFSTMGANKDNASGMAAGDYITVEFTGEITGEDTSAVRVLSIALFE